MKKTIVLILAVLFLFTSCNAEETASTASEQYADADEYLDSIGSEFGYFVGKDPLFENAIWLESDGHRALDVRIPLGTVQVSPNLIDAMEHMPGNLRIRVVVSFASMLPEEYWNTVLEGRTVKEYYEIIEAREDLEAANLARGLLYSYKHEWFSKIYRTIRVSDEQAILGGVCQDSFCFYACLTKDEILELTCNEDEAFYIFAEVFK